jgi:hypothetical protein
VAERGGRQRTSYVRRRGEGFIVAPEPHENGLASALNASVGELVTALALFVVGTTGVLLSLTMERPARWYTAPGLVPLLLSLGLSVMAFILLTGAVRRGALASSSIRKATRLPAQALRYAAAVGGIGCFYFLLLRFLPFELACFVYLLGMFRVFWPEATWVRQVLAALGLALTFVVGFQLGFDIPLPGHNNLLEQLLFRLR